MAKFGEETRTATNSFVYNRAIKNFRESTGEISCARCPYNKVENHKRVTKRCWKKYRKRQWK